MRPVLAPPIPADNAVQLRARALQRPEFFQAASGDVAVGVRGHFTQRPAEFHYCVIR
jgi:hypothetical protein